MSLADRVTDAFPREERSKGEMLLVKDLVSISSSTDSDVRAFVKGSSSARVTLTAEGVAADSFRVACSCPKGRGGILCRHAWAVLVKLEEHEADFLQGKERIEESGAPPPSAATRKQENYKKERYEKQKERAKEMRRAKKGSPEKVRFTYPAQVEEALVYFLENGFPLEPLEFEALLGAKKSLSRVFHPDKGGTHAEAIALNRYFEVIRDYLKS